MSCSCACCRRAAAAAAAVGAWLVMPSGHVVRGASFIGAAWKPETPWTGLSCRRPERGARRRSAVHRRPFAAHHSLPKMLPQPAPFTFMVIERAYKSRGLPQSSGAGGRRLPRSLAGLAVGPAAD